MAMFVGSPCSPFDSNPGKFQQVFFRKPGNIWNQRKITKSNLQYSSMARQSMNQSFTHDRLLQEQTRLTPPLSQTIAENDNPNEIVYTAWYDVQNCIYGAYIGKYKCIYSALFFCVFFLYIE